MDEPDEEWHLVLKFDSDHPEFTRGFEAGQIWEQVNRDRALIAVMHASNTEMLMRIAESLGLSFRAEILDETWVQVTIDEPLNPADP